jgi:hypothetical protein
VGEWVGGGNSFFKMFRLCGVLRDAVSIME